MRYEKKLAKDAATKPFIETMKAAAAKMKNAGMKYSAQFIDGGVKVDKALGGDMKDLLKMGGKVVSKFATPAGLAYDILGNPSVANQGEAEMAKKWFTDKGLAVPQYVEDWVKREGGIR